MNWFRPRRREEDLDRELNTHLELESEEQHDGGLPAGESHFAARRAFGNITSVREDVREQWGWTRLESMLQDFRFAWRRLWKSPGFAFTAILTLALGIGASTAVFSVVESVLLKPLRYADSDRIVTAWEHVTFLGGDPIGPNPRHVGVWKTRSNAFQDWTSLNNGTIPVALPGQNPRQLGRVVCEPNLFRLLGVLPAQGRDFLPGEGRPGSAEVAILTYAGSQALFPGETHVIGKVITVGGTPREIVGVLPASFHFPNANTLRAFPSGQPKSGIPDPSIFLPAIFDYSQMEWNGNYGNFIALARLADGTNLAQATAQLNTIQDQIWSEMPGGPRTGTLRASLQPMQEAIVGDSSYGILLLMGAVAGLLLLACLNLANAQLGRAIGMSRDAALRAALGARRWRLLWTALAENLLLGLLGGGLGILLAFLNLDLFRRYCPIDLPRLTEVRIDPAALCFSLAVTIAASLLSGMLPGLRLSSVAPQSSLQQGGRSFGNRSSQRLRVWLIGLQVFGCTVLLLATGLFSRSLLHLMKQDKGFDTAQAAVAEVRLIPKYFPDGAARMAFIERSLQALRSIPGAGHAGFVSAMPLEGESWIEHAQRPDRRGEKSPMVNARWVSPGYFEATRQRLVAGRFFEERDRDLSSIILSESEAKSLWGAADPIGGTVDALGKTFTVIGVVADSRNTSLKAPPARMIYVHYTYRTPGQMFFVARGAGQAEDLVTAMRDAIARQSSNATVARVKTLDAQLNDSLARERFQTLVLGAFGASALLLAMLGIYGILSFSVAARKQEIGLRMALGATRANVYTLTVGEASVPVVAGLAAGLAASFASVRIIEKFLYGTKAIDLPVILSVTLLFALAAAAAAFVPARRATSINPVDALRSE